jgi:hypothetical protein
MEAIEATGTTDGKRGVILDRELPFDGARRVRVILLLADEDDQDEAEWMRAAATNPAFDFLEHPDEDIYAATDGEPFDDQG